MIVEDIPVIRLLDEKTGFETVIADHPTVLLEPTVYEITGFSRFRRAVHLVQSEIAAFVATAGIHTAVKRIRVYSIQ
jgi:hypothetical protein